MISAKPFVAGKLSGIIYDCEAGEGLPWHSHGEHDIHITIVAKGRVRARGNGWERVLQPGDIVDWEVGDPHELTAIERARFINILR